MYVTCLSHKLEWYFFDRERRVIDKNVATVQSQIHGGNVQLRE